MPTHYCFPFPLIDIIINMNQVFSQGSSRDGKGEPDTWFLGDNPPIKIWGPVLLILFFAGLYLRLFCLSYISFGSDDFFDLIRAYHGFAHADMLMEMRYNPPLHQIPKMAILHAGGNIAAIRYLFILFSALLIPGVFFTGRRYFGSYAGLAAAFLVAVNWEFIFIAASSRGLGLAICFLMCATYFYYDVVNHNSRHGLFVLFSLLALYSHYFAFSVILCQAAYLVMVKRGAGARRAVIALTLLALPAFCMIGYGMTLRNVEFPRAGGSSLHQFLLDLPGLLTKPELGFLLAVLVVFPGRKHAELSQPSLFALTLAIFAGLFYEVKLAFMLMIFPLIWICSCGIPLHRGRKLFKGIFLAMYLMTSSLMIANTACMVSELKRTAAHATRVAEIILKSPTRVVFFEQEPDIFMLYGAIVEDIPLLSRNAASLIHRLEPTSDGYSIEVERGNVRLIFPGYEPEKAEAELRSMHEPAYWVVSLRPDPKNHGPGRFPNFCKNTPREATLLLCNPPENQGPRNND